jgi:hypothetical protein
MNEKQSAAPKNIADDKPDYPFVEAWNRYMGGLPYYGNVQVQKAHNEGAPKTAIYKDYSGRWVTMEAVSPGSPAAEWFAENEQALLDKYDIQIGYSLMLARQPTRRTTMASTEQEAKASKNIVLNLIWNQTPEGLKASGILQNGGTFDEFKRLPDVVTVAGSIKDGLGTPALTLVKRGWNSDTCTVYYSELERNEVVAKAVKS